MWVFEITVAPKAMLGRNIARSVIRDHAASD